MAKIADFGMSRLIDPKYMTHSLSVVGHRSGYLPPEGVQGTNNYDLSLDVHMFGVVMVQIVHAVKGVNSPEERQMLIDNIAEHHPLKDIIKSCVAVAKEDRPTAESVSTSLKELVEFTNADS